jgi:hypothetical protein
VAGVCIGILSETSRSRGDDERNKEIGEEMNGSLPLTEKISVWAISQTKQSKPNCARGDRNESKK